MRYTARKKSGLLAMFLGVILISRFSPDWLFYTVLVVATIFLLSVIYYYSSY